MRCAGGRLRTSSVLTHTHRPSRHTRPARVAQATQSTGAYPAALQPKIRPADSQGPKARPAVSHMAAADRMSALQVDKCVTCAISSNAVCPVKGEPHIVGWAYHEGHGGSASHHMCMMCITLWRSYSQVLARSHWGPGATWGSGFRLFWGREGRCGKLSDPPA